MSRLDRRNEEQIRAVRASRRYHRAILVNRLVIVGGVGWVFIIFGAPSRVATPYFAGLFLLGMAGSLMLALAGVPTLTFNWRMQSIVTRDLLDIGWWWGPPPPR